MTPESCIICFYSKGLGKTVEMKRQGYNNSNIKNQRIISFHDALRFQNKSDFKFITILNNRCFFNLKKS
jgi:hypothetical protein